MERKNEEDTKNVRFVPSNFCEFFFFFKILLAIAIILFKNTSYT